MSKIETSRQIKVDKATALWQPQLNRIAATAEVRPAFVRLAMVTLEGGRRELQLCVNGRGDSDTKNNYRAVTRAVKALAASAGLSAIPVKRCSRSCEGHTGAAPV